MRLNLGQPLLRHAPALVLDFDENRFAFASDLDRSALAPRVPVNIGQAFLHQSEHHQLNLVRKSTEFFRNGKRDVDAAAFAQSVDVTTERRGETAFAQDRK